MTGTRSISAGRGTGLFLDSRVSAAVLLSLATPGLAGEVTVEPTFTTQVDAVTIDGPGAQSVLDFRRIRPGLRGKIGPSLTWAAELEVVGGPVRFTNFFVALTPKGSPVSVVVGQIFPPTSLETLSTANGSSFLERAQLHDVFAFGRRFGAVVALQKPDILLTVSAFGNDMQGSLPPGSRFLALRGVWAPSVGQGRLHIGANVKWRDAGDRGTIRYGARQGSALLDTLLLDTGRVQASGDTNIGAEIAGVFGRLSFASEIQHASLHDPAANGLADVSAGYAEVGWYLTPDDSKVYELGRFGRTRPAHPVGEGGIGAWQASLRGDWAKAGDRQQILSASLHWTATKHVRMVAQLSQVRHDPAGLAPASRSTLIGLRTQYIY